MTTDLFSHYASFRVSFPFSLGGSFAEVIDSYNGRLASTDELPYSGFEDYLTSLWVETAQELIKNGYAEFANDNNKDEPNDKLINMLKDTISQGNFFQVEAALILLRENLFFNRSRYYETLLELDTHPAVQIKLAKQLVDSYAEMGLSAPDIPRAIHYLSSAAKNPDTRWSNDVSALLGIFITRKYINSAQYFGLMEELAKADCPLAKFEMGRFLCRDIEIEGAINTKIYFEGAEGKIDHDQAKNYFQQLVANRDRFPRSISYPVGREAEKYLVALEEAKRPEQDEKFRP